MRGWINMTYLESMDDVIEYLKQDNPNYVVIVFRSPDEYYDFVQRYYNTFFKKYYNFVEKMTDTQVNNYCPFGVRLSPISTETNLNEWGYGSLKFYQKNEYKVFAIYSELIDTRRKASATEQEISDFLFA